MGNRRGPPHMLLLRGSDFVQFDAQVGDLKLDFQRHSKKYAELTNGKEIHVELAVQVRTNLTRANEDAL